MRPQYLRIHLLADGIAYLIYQLNNGRFAAAMWDIDADKAVMIVSCVSRDKATKVFKQMIADAEKYC